ncbi:MAG TPA: tetratricopeptide repeat protein [Anaerolineae bacterium]|nr:tetratricopeptide repeat protein [Anaerolineae bacterium]
MIDTRPKRAPMWKRWWARWCFLRATFHRHWGNLGSGRAAYERAVDFFTRAVESDRLFVNAYYQRGVLYWREIQNYHHAIRDFTRVLELDPQRTLALYMRALAYQSRGDYDDAIADYERFLSVDGGSVWGESARIQLDGARDLRDARNAHRAR